MPDFHKPKDTKPQATSVASAPKEEVTVLKDHAAGIVVPAETKVADKRFEELAKNAGETLRKTLDKAAVEAKVAKVVAPLPKPAAARWLKDLKATWKGPFDCHPFEHVEAKLPELLKALGL